MASISYLIKGKNDPASIYIRFRHGKKFDISKSIQKTVSPKDWSPAKKAPHPRNPHLKNLDIKLQNLSIKVQERFNNSDIDEIDDVWQITPVNNPKYFRLRKTNNPRIPDTNFE